MREIVEDVACYKPGNGAPISTHSGKLFDVLNPNPKDFVPDDAVVALSRVCRFGGHTSRFYSVAQHSVYVFREVESYGCDGITQMSALWHDVAEAYLGDMCRPIKRLFPKYCELETQVKTFIFGVLGIPTTGDWDAIKFADNSVCRSEASVLMRHSDTWNWADVPPAATCGLNHPSDAMFPETAEHYFRVAWRELRALYESDLALCS